MPTAIVIDNEPVEVRRLANLLEGAFPEWTVLPEKEQRETRPMRDWNEIAEYLLKIRDADVVLCLDLGLGEQDFHDIERGVQRARDLRRDRPKWTIVAFTRYTSFALGTSDASEIFDGFLEKSDLARASSFEAGVELVRSVTERARTRHGAPGSEALPPDLKILDSLGMRLFRAAFSDETLGELIRNEARDWGSIKVESLTSGYSGAYMLKLTSNVAGRSLILKIAKSESTVADEIQAQEKYLPELAPFCNRLVPIDRKLKRFHDGSGVYYRQLPVQGMTSLQYCIEHPFPGNLKVLERIAKISLRVLNAAPVEDRLLENARINFELTPVDIGRIETSIDFLTGIGGALAASGLWMSALPSASTVGGEVLELAKNWANDMMTDVLLPQSVQHGDMNPGNVMVDADDEPALIDFQRLRRWPLGYDVARIAGLLRVRLTDIGGRADWLPFHFAEWCEPSVAQIEGREVEDQVCPEASFFDTAFFEWTAGLSERTRLNVEYGYRLGSIWDMMKIMSYTDVSAVKRCWILVRCWSLIQRLRVEHALLT